MKGNVTSTFFQLSNNYLNLGSYLSLISIQEFFETLLKWKEKNLIKYDMLVCTNIWSNSSVYS
jgi:hypothetical protein